jgi:formate/nitrite transporter
VNMFSPLEVASNACGAGHNKMKLSLDRIILLGILAGAYIGFGANLATVVGSDVGQLGAGVGQFLFGAVFSVGLMLVVIGGAELFTGNNMFLTICAMDGRISWGGVLYHWAVVWLANFAGSLLLVWIVFHGFYYAMPDGSMASGLLGGAVMEKAVGIATAKCSLPWGAAFCRAILCNWLVCLAVWMSLAAKDVIGKIFSCFFPIMAFVASGFEHSVANMFFVPMGIFLTGGVDTVVNWSNFLVGNLIPVTLGNIVGGGIFVAGFYWWSYLRVSK